MTEIWKDVKNYEGLYQVSNLGNVRSVDRMETLSNGRKRLRKGRIMKPQKLPNGYYKFHLYKDGILTNISIHRLVAEAFLPNPDNLPQVNHRDENKRNNCVSNLEWCTCSHNANYGTRNKRIIEKLSMTVLQIDKDTNEIIAEYPSVNEAGRHTGFSIGHICNCCRGIRKSTGGFKWKYK